MLRILFSLGTVLLLTACSNEVSLQPTPSSGILIETATPQAIEQVSGTPSVVITSLHQQDPPNYVSTPNHSSILQKEEVSIPAGKATLLTIAQDNFTAVTEHEPGAKTDTVYFLYISKPNPTDSSLYDTYILSGLVTGDPAVAKKDLLAAANLWKPPLK